jgi:hypothetical protein
MPIWDTPPQGFSTGYILSNGSPAPCTSGQNVTASSFDSQTWQVVATCNEAGSGGCGGEFEFVGAWVGTQLAPLG